MKARDLPAYVKSEKSTMALWMTLMGDSNGKETWNLAIQHSPVTLVHVAGLAVLESSFQWSQLYVAREKLQDSFWVQYSLYIYNSRPTSYIWSCLVKGVQCVCMCVCGDFFLVI